MIMECCGKGDTKAHGAKLIWLIAVSVIVVLFAVFVFNISLGNILFYGAVLACPFMHIFMMKDHGKHEEHQESDKEVPHHH